MPTRFNDQIDNEYSSHANDEMWELLNIYADGEASPEEAARVEELLRSDASYSRQLGFVRTTTAAVQSFTELDPPASLRDAIFASTLQRATWGSRVARLRNAVQRSIAPRYATSLVGLAAAGLIAFVVVQHNSSPSSHQISNSGQSSNRSSVASDLGSQDADFTKYFEPTFDFSSKAPLVTPASHQAQATRTRARIADLNPLSKKRSLNTAQVGPHIAQSGTQSIHHEEVVAVAYRPNMDEQFERNPGSVAVPENQPVEIPGDDVHIAESDPMPAASRVPSTSAALIDSAQSNMHGTVTHTYVAHLTALPPDPNQVMTRADMARNRAVMTSGYDRSTLKSMERKETSISILKGTF